MPLSDVTVNISYTLTPITRAEFNRPLLLVEETGGSPEGQYATYSSLDQVSEDYPSDTVAYKMAAAIFSQRIRPADIAIYNIGSWTEPSELTDALDSILNAGHTGWYYLIPATRDNAARAALANWVDANRRVLILGNADAEDVSTFIAAIQALGSVERVVAVYHATNEADANYLEAALAGWVGGRYPAACAWFDARINGITPNSITYSEIQSLKDANVITWAKTPIGVWVTVGGKTLSGDWADIVVALDFLEARLKERIWSLLVDNDRIPYTQEGINQIAAAVEAELHRLARAPYGIIATDENGTPLCAVYPPDRDQIDAIEVRNRRIPDLPFQATVAGAVETVVVNGVLTEDVVNPYGATVAE